MTYDPHKHHRRSIRLQGYDYTQAGAYFVTICVQDGSCLLGEIINSEMVLSSAGKMVTQIWQEIADKFPTAVNDAYVCMPNHIHFIIFLDNTKSGKQSSLFDVVQWFKSITTAKYRHGVYERSWPPYRQRLWQRNYYEHIIRNERALHGIRRYIYNNPINWQKDEFHQNASGI